MNALQHIKDYLASKFAGHDIETLMTHFETAIEAKVEEGLADLKQEIAELRNEVMPVTAAKPAPTSVSVAAINPNMTAPEVLEAAETTTENAK